MYRITALQTRGADGCPPVAGVFLSDLGARTLGEPPCSIWEQRIHVTARVELRLLINSDSPAHEKYNLLANYVRRKRVCSLDTVVEIGCTMHIRMLRVGRKEYRSKKNWVFEHERE
jgi:hypothetical protein